jgi:hypothetical protein
MLERSIELVKPRSPVSLIVQLTVLSSEKLHSLQDLLVDRGSLYALPFPRRPESMFDGVEMPVAILISTGYEPKEYISSRVLKCCANQLSKPLPAAYHAAHKASDIR